MQFGVFYEIQVPKPWYETKVITSAKDTLGQFLTCSQEQRRASWPSMMY